MMLSKLKKKIIKIPKKSFQFLSSLKLAFLTFILFIVVLSLGTYIESRYDAETAQAWVYKSYFLYFLFILLILNLFFVMLSRWPWKKRHTGFLLAHIGIIILLIGALLTYQYGIDGSIYLPLGEKTKFVSIAPKELAIFSSFNGESYTLLYQEKVNFLNSPPQKKPKIFPLNNNKNLKITHYHHFSLRKGSIIESKNPMSGTALKFQLWNKQVNEIEWIFLPFEQDKKNFETFSLGPAQIILSHKSSPINPSGNTIVFYISPPQNQKPLFKTSSLKESLRSKKKSLKENKKEKKIFYKIYSSKKNTKSQNISSGWVSEGETIQTGWMDLQLRVLRFLEKAKLKFEYEVLNQKTEESIPSLRLSFDGEEYALGLNSFLRIFTEKEVYVISFTNQKIDLGFNVHLKDFKIKYYPGTKTAQAYESDVLVESKPYKISMNKPLKHKGFTFYQSSFQENEKKEVIASILSVNKDPGRFLKYLGSSLLALGTFILFYFKKPRKRPKRIQE